MRCDEACALLGAFADGAGAPPAPDQVIEAVRLGWLEAVDGAPAEPEGGDAREAVKAATAALAAARASLRGMAPFERTMQEARVADLEASLRRHRSALLDAQSARMRTSAVVSEAGAHRLTWRGRELLDELGPRVYRCGPMPVAQMIAEMDTLRARLRELAVAAGAVAAKLSTEHLAIDEMHLRYAALGLAARDEAGTPGASTKGWEVALKLLEGGPVAPEDHPVAAEIAACSGNAAGVVQRVHAILREVGAGGAAPVGVALALAVSPDPTALLVEATRVAAAMAGGAPSDGATGETNGLGALAAPVAARSAGAPRARAVDVLIAAVGADVATVRDVRNRLFGVPDELSDLVAALIVLSGRGADAGTQAWRALEEEVARLHPGQGALVAGMLVLLDGPPAALIDDLRLAAEAVSAARLAVGGFEVLVQAARLLVLVALATTPPAMAPRPSASARSLSLPALAAAAPAVLLGAQPVLLAAIAADSVAALRHYRFLHPAHRAGVYSG